MSEATPRDRLLETAARLFYAAGIHAVGVDRLVTEAQVTRATFYRHFPTKDDLVVAYLQARHNAIRAGVHEATRAKAGTEAVYAIFELVGAETCGPGFRGCPFINAAAEYPDPDHPVRTAITNHRAWFSTTFRTYLAQAGHPDPDRAAATLVLLRDGALSGGELDDPEAVRATLRHAARAVIGEK